MPERAIEHAFSDLRGGVRRAAPHLIPPAGEPPDGFVHRYAEIVSGACLRILGNSAVQLARTGCGSIAPPQGGEAHAAAACGARKRQHSDNRRLRPGRAHAVARQGLRYSACRRTSRGTDRGRRARSLRAGGLCTLARADIEAPGGFSARFPHGWYRFDYALEGDLKEVELHKLQKILVQAELRITGWPVFWVPTRKDLVPREIDGVVECWLPPSDDDTPRAHFDAAHCDFWRAAPTGRMFLIRGYQEDAQETFAPGTIFDTGLPIWRLGEALLHAARLATLLRQDEGSTDHGPFSSALYRPYRTRSEGMGQSVS